jgi:hypothetical protein
VAVKAKLVIDTCARLLLDDSNVGWGRSELLGYLNMGQKQIVAIKPEANPARTVITLVGGTRQSLPAGGYQLIKATRNFQSDGTTAADAIRLGNMEVLDQVNPGWHADATSATVKEYMHDIQEPTIFWVYPPQPGSGQGKIEVVYSMPPADVADLTADPPGGTGPNTTDSINIPDIYMPALVDYIMARAYLKNSDRGTETAMAMTHYNAFLSALGVLDKNNQLRNPNVQLMPFSPTTPAAAR